MNKDHHHHRILLGTDVTENAYSNCFLPAKALHNAGVYGQLLSARKFITFVGSSNAPISKLCMLRKTSNWFDSFPFKWLLLLGLFVAF